MPKGVGRVFRKCVTYNQSGLNYPPLAFKEFPSCEDVLYHISVYLIEIFLLVCHCWLAVATSLTLIKAKSLRHIVVFSVGFVSVWFSHSGNLYLNSWKAERTPLPHPTLFQKTRGKPYTLKVQTSSSVKPTIHLLVANAMSVCNLVSTLFFCLSLPRVVSDLNMSYFSEVMVVGRDGGGKF